MIKTSGLFFIAHSILNLKGKQLLILIQSEFGDIYKIILKTEEN